MADISIALRALDSRWAKQNQEAVWISKSPTCASWITGKAGTFCIVRDGDDAAASAGYVCHPDAKSMQQTLSQILSSFQESQIPDLKRTLIGQYVILVKKGGRIYLFTDFIGGRNLFYSASGLTVSSSFGQAESLEGTSADDLDPYKVLEFLAMKEVLYPAWLGSGTCHRRIKWLLPYEYLVVDMESATLRVGSIVYSIDNEKVSDCPALAEELLANLSAVISRPEFKDSLVGATLTGGHDSRLVAGIAARHYRNIHYRIAFSPQAPRTLKDIAVAQKVARIRQVPLDVYEFAAADHEARFRDLTEGLTPCFNNTITPLLDQAGSYSLGLGGVFGTELFQPLPWGSIDEFVQKAIQRAKRSLSAERSFWDTFEGSIHAGLHALKRHYDQPKDDERDQIRLFMMLDTARYASFILSAFNRSGYQLDPYGSHSVFRLSFRVAPALWGNHRRFGGNSLVQKAAMAKLDPTMGSVLTYMHSRPMLPLSIGTFPSYLGGYLLQGTHYLKDKVGGARGIVKQTALPGGTYSSNGWEKQFVERLRQKYSLNAGV